MTTRLFLILLAAVVLPLPVHHAAQREDAASIMDREPGVVRIGISGDPVKRRVYARGGIVVRDPVDRKPVWKRRFTPGVYFVSDNSTGRERMIYRVQIASFESEELASRRSWKRFFPTRRSSSPIIPTAGRGASASVRRAPGRRPPPSFND
jgi:hypothetical protein